MYVDALQLVSDGQHVTATAPSASSIDLGNVTPKRQIGDGEVLGFKVSVKAAGVNSGSLLLQAIASSTPDLATAPAVIGAVNAAAADLVLGAEFFVMINQGTPKQQFIGMSYAVTGVVDVTLQAELTLATMAGGKPVSYAKAYTISG